MLEEEIKYSFNLVNDMINKLIDSITKYNLDENALILVANSTKHLMSFTQRILLKLLFKFFNTVCFVGTKVTDDLVDVDEIVTTIFDQMAESLNNILIPNNDTNKQQYLDDMVHNLTFLKDVINTLSNLFLSVLKFQADIIDEDEFRQNYRNFKSDVGEYNDTLKNMVEEEKITIPIS